MGLTAESEKLLEYLPFILPIVLMELTLMAVALVHVLRHKQYRIRNRLRLLPSIRHC